MATPNLKICTVYFEGMYTPDYVDKLYNSLKRNITRDFEFYCISENPNVKADKVFPLSQSLIKRHWHKLRFFDPKLIGASKDDEIIIMDIDQVIMQNIDELVNYPVEKNEIISYDKWWKSKYYLEAGFSHCTLNGGWYKFRGDSLKFIADDYKLDPEERQLRYYNNGTVHFKYYGEQNYVEDTCKENNIKITLMPGEWVGKVNLDPDVNVKNNIKYCQAFDEKYMILGGEPNPKIKIIHFAGVKDTIHEYDSWINDYWY